LAQGIGGIPERSMKAIAHMLDDRRRRRERLKTHRKLWLNIHLSIGLVAGVMLSVIGATGSILVFWQEIDEILDPSMFTVQAPPEGERAFLPLANIRSALQSAVSSDAKIGGVGMPRSPGGCYKVYYDEPASGSTRRLCIDPYNARILGDKIYWSKHGPLDHSLMSFLFQLHWSLLLYDLFDDNGIVVGVSAIFLTLSVFTGIYLWWPAPGKWRAALTLKLRAKGERLNYDLHKIGGLYTFPVLLVILVSGVSMNLHEQFIWVVERVSPLSAAERGQVKSSPANGRVRIPFDVAVAAAEARYPEGQLKNIGFPGGEDGVYRVCRTDIAALGRFVGTRCVLVDQYSGEILSVVDPAEGTAGNVFMQWQWPLHSGQAFGWTGRILVFITGLICPLLFATGVIRWLQKRRAKRIQTERTNPSARRS
jgi:uncharacterized iron-regulated membrane protein